MSRQGCDTKCGPKLTPTSSSSQRNTLTKIPSVSQKEIRDLTERYLWFRNYPIYAQRWSFKRIWRTIVCGWHSNIPVCCIVFFLLCWSPLFYLTAFSWVQRFIEWWPPSKRRFNYVACPLCVLRNKRNRLKICSESTGCAGCCRYNKVQP